MSEVERVLLPRAVGSPPIHVRVDLAAGLDQSAITLSPNLIDWLEQQRTPEEWEKILNGDPDGVVPKGIIIAKGDDDRIVVAINSNENEDLTSKRFGIPPLKEIEDYMSNEIGKRLDQRLLANPAVLEACDSINSSHLNQPVEDLGELPARTPIDLGKVKPSSLHRTTLEVLNLVNEQRAKDRVISKNQQRKMARLSTTPNLPSGKTGAVVKRNAKCPCGSKKKFKDCCLEKVRC